MSLMRQFQQPTPAPKKPAAKRPASSKLDDDGMPSFLAPPPKRRGPKPSGNAKELVSLRLSKDALDKFRATGKGWQARIDEALRKVTP